MCGGKMNKTRFGATDVYIAAIGQGPIEPVCPPVRQARIEAAANEKQRRQRYFAWKLLEFALENSFGLRLEQQEFSVDKNGKWCCGACFFSLSHSREAVAVAVSDRPVGVDIECLNRNILPGLAHKILTQRELLAYHALDAEKQKIFLLEKWCAKESIYKKDSRPFAPRQTETEGNAVTGVLEVAGHAYAYAVATDQPERLRICSRVIL